ncbi:YadA-like family protein [Salmonella enterica]|uniref:YadA-like family protein n=1 Tax=Salmonella enterica TaxID=28901 RepID=UPI0009AC4C90|nr:YadA-like family protein [Salmonella enterica]
MNRIFKVLWNAATGTFVVTSETAKSRGKKSGRRKLAVSALISLSSIMVSADVLANAGKDTGSGVTPSDSTAGTGWIAIGTDATANTYTNVDGASAAMGYHASAMGKWSTAIGSYSQSTGNSSLALGVKSVSAGDRAIAMGASSSAGGSYSMAMGVYADSSGANSVALGYKSVASGATSAALGYQATASGDDSAAFGNGAQAIGTNSVALGAGSTALEDNSVAVGNSTTQRQITYVAKGDINANSTDAVTGAQIYSLSQSVADRLGGGASVNSDGTVNAPLYKVGTGIYNNVGSALSALNTSITNTEASVAGLAEDALLWDGNTSAFSANHSGSDSKITNLAAGTLAADSTDAVNGSQLFATNENVSQNTTDITANTDSINQNTTDIATNTTSINNLSNSVTTLTDDALLWDAASGAFNANRNGNASKIINVAAGDLSEDSTDAVNGSQLYETNQKVDQNTSAIADINTSITNLSSDNLSWNETTSSFSASHGSSTTNKITNVAAGELSEESTDAVNGSQLFETNEKVDQNTTDIAANTTNITQNSTAIENLNTSVSDINTSITGLTDNALLWDEDIGAFSANHGGSISKITNVAAGALSEDSTDAVNGSQLYETNQKVDQNTSAIADINTSITNLGTDALSWDDEEGAFSASHGTSGTNKITNVAAGEIASDSTDAVNGSQLYETNLLISQYNESISQLAGDTSETYITENGTGVKYIRTNDNGLEGQDAYATGNGATAVGYNAVASGASSLALGENSSSIDGSIALGSGSTSNRAISSGIRATSVTSDGVVIGYNTTDRELLGALSLGTDGVSYRQITNVADGSEAQDAVTVRQLQNAIGAVATTPTKYYHANSTEEDSLAVGTDSLAMGAKTIVNADAGIGIGIGLNTLVMADAINGIAIGSNARANHANSIAMGNGSQTTRGAQTDYTAYNMDTPQNSVGEFSVGSEDGQRQITNVAAGSADTDAVNVSQLKVTDSRVAANTESINNLNTQVSSLDTRVTNIENGIGDIVTTGSTKYFKTNTDGVDANAQGADSVAIGSGSIAAAENSVALGTNSVADEANTVSVGSSTQQRRITNVAAGVNNTDAVNVAQLKASEAGSVRYETNADGSVNYSVLNLGDGSGGTTRIGNVSAAVNDTDAVNYAQLKRSVEEANTYTDQKMGEMNSKIKGVENKMSGGIASAMAMAGLPQAYAPGANMTSIAGGTFNGESAVAIGISMVSESGGWVYKLQGTSNSQGDYSAAIGAGFQW